jgi:hypothetical protein
MYNFATSARRRHRGRSSTSASRGRGRCDACDARTGGLGALPIPASSPGLTSASPERASATAPPTWPKCSRRPHGRVGERGRRPDVFGSCPEAEEHPDLVDAPAGGPGRAPGRGEYGAAAHAPGGAVLRGDEAASYGTAPTKTSKSSGKRAKEVAGGALERGTPSTRTRRSLQLLRRCAARSRTRTTSAFMVSATRRSAHGPREAHDEGAMLQVHGVGFAKPRLRRPVHEDDSRDSAPEDAFHETMAAPGLVAGAVGPNRPLPPSPPMRPNMTGAYGLAGGPGPGLRPGRLSLRSGQHGQLNAWRSAARKRVLTHRARRPGRRPGSESTR